MCRLQSTLAAAPSSVAGKCLETNFLSEIGQHRASRQATEFGEKRLGGEGEALFPAKDETEGALYRRFVERAPRQARMRTSCC